MENLKNLNFLGFRRTATKSAKISHPTSIAARR